MDKYISNDRFFDITTMDVACEVKSKEKQNSEMKTAMPPSKLTKSSEKVILQKKFERKAQEEKKMK